MTDPPQAMLGAVAREIEQHVDRAGWDQPPRLYALVPTEELAAAEPALAAHLGIDTDTAATSALTPVEQEGLPVDRTLEEALHGIVWPESVSGCAAAVERLVLPPDAEQRLPEEPGQAAEYAARHPDRRDVRIVAAVTRDGRTHCALRLRTGELVEGADLVPGLLALLKGTLES